MNEIDFENMGYCDYDSNNTNQNIQNTQPNQQTQQVPQVQQSTSETINTSSDTNLNNSEIKATSNTNEFVSSLEGEIDEIILKHFLYDEKFFGKILSVLKAKHFKKIEHQKLYHEAINLFEKYSKKPTIKEIALSIKNSTKLDENTKHSLLNEIKHIHQDIEMISNHDFVIDQSVKYIQRQELINAIYSSAEILDKNEDNFTKILDLVESALKIQVDTNVGFDYSSIDSDDYLYEYYTAITQKFKLSTMSLNDILDGGITTKGLHIVLGASHSGKSGFLVDSACGFARQKIDTVYFTLEMPEEEIAKRVDSNLLRVNTWNLKNLTKAEYKQMKKVAKQDLGHLLIKEYPAGVLNTLMIENYLMELEQQKGIKPKVLVIDYLTLMSSSRVSISKAGGMYQYYKLISEELHGLAKKYDIAILSASQLNRSGFNNLEAEMESIADSIGIIQTADTALALLSNPKLREEKLVMAKFLKNRLTGQLKSTLLQVDFPTMTFSDTEDYIQQKLGNGDNNQNQRQVINENNNMTVSTSKTPFDMDTQASFNNGDVKSLNAFGNIAENVSKSNEFNGIKFDNSIKSSDEFDF